MPSYPQARQQQVLIPGYYHYQYGDVFFPGTQNVVFQPAFQLPKIQLIGAAIYAGALSPIQPPQVFAPQTNTIAGLGGLVAGQFISQPLSQPETTNGSA